jgi:hypothetical protein
VNLLEGQTAANDAHAVVRSRGGPAELDERWQNPCSVSSDSEHDVLMGVRKSRCLYLDGRGHCDMVGGEKVRGGPATKRG